ncbi:hypothetical protein D6D04_06015 [Aureobasidium pullulans]|nr:hypothetical protein D6D25_02000 [Aureobasidium pullulans]THX78009.1 hypothetical protein D6D04_06015 [Aureobasidium pullulans]
MTTFTPINRVDYTAGSTSSGALGGGGGGGGGGGKKPERGNEGPLSHRDDTDDFDITTAGLIATFVDLLYCRRNSSKKFSTCRTLNSGTRDVNFGACSNCAFTGHPELCDFYDYSQCESWTASKQKTTNLRKALVKKNSRGTVRGPGSAAPVPSYNESGKPCSNGCQPSTTGSLSEWCMQGRTTMSFAPQDATNVPHAKRICLAPTISVELQQPNDGRGRQSRTAMSATPVRSGSREKGFGQTERPAKM